MDLTGSFFGKLRALVTTLERQAEQLKQAFRGDETEFEDDSPMRYLYELYSEIRTLKGEADNVLTKKSEERDATYDFIKASKVLMNRNAACLGRIRDVFEKYGYKPIIREAATKDEAETDPEPAKSVQEELENLGCPENSSRPDSLVRIPQLSDFGLSKYALPSTWNTVNILQQAHAQKEQPRDDYSGCPSPKIEQFCIKGRDLCVDDDTVYLTEDQTIFLLNNAKKSRQDNKMNRPSVALASKENLSTPVQKSKVCVILLQPPYVTQMIPDKRCVEEAVAPVLSSNKYLDCFATPAPPAISDYESMHTTPPPAPEITVIPTQILQILSKYSSNTEPPRVTEKVKNEGMATKFERRPALEISNKENSEYCG
ncbi:UNVERIFIED_CONTAM: hypothetical protein K2H54_066572 [Gekko kuhli]